MNMTFIEQCEDILCRLFYHVSHDLFQWVSEIDAIAKEWGYSEDEIKRVVEYLSETGLIDTKPMSGAVLAVKITPEGIDYAMNMC
jgi:RIO-like serine/threonine protein kinase